ncbi:cell division protein ZapE [Rheinheimera salexigens]|uniref:cell division protein ZapE n=1 Tax=Rheinheimera salexigens TaxID=1628148 RepID=UPI000AC8E9B5|nr:cell division protein ZapE [Rheinheimera salexigens]
MLAQYQQQIETTALRYDEAQYQLIQQLQLLAQQLNAGETPRQGIYIYGPVGRGKTMLMDSFYQHLKIKQKIRLHFHHFMARVHKELDRLTGQADPLEQIAKNWAKQYKVLCFDEFFVNDIGDAMLLGTLWQALFSHGVLLVTTSNAPPSQLYVNGLQRQRFLPTISLLEHYCQLINLDNGIDYRRSENSPKPYYLQHGSATQLQRLSQQLFGPVQACQQVSVQQRSIDCLWRNEYVIGFDFMALCHGPRSQLDYMQLAAQYKAIAVHQVPQFSYLAEKAIVHGVEDQYQREHKEYFVSKMDDEARRFIALVDECYDKGCLLLLSAEVDIADLYQAKQLAFAFERSTSRLYEMQRWQIEQQITQ